MRTIAFKDPKNPPDLFRPLCKELHQLYEFDFKMSHGSSLYLLDDKGWLYELASEDPVRLNGIVEVSTECEKCIESGFMAQEYRYNWALDFTFGLLRRVWQRPCEELGIEARELLKLRCYHL